MLRLTTLPEEIKREYRAPDTGVSKTVLIELVRLKDPAAPQLAMWDAVKSGNLTQREVRRRKAGTEPTSPIHRLIAAGRVFADTLGRVEAGDHVLARDEIEELCALYERIGRAISNISQL